MPTAPQQERPRSLLGRCVGAALVLGSLAYPFAVARLRDQLLPRLLPSLVSLYAAGVFGWSLHRGPPLIERVARVVERGDLPPFTLLYCRRVTVLWCAFLVANAFVGIVLAMVAPGSWWALYTGGIAYGLIGLLLAGELCYRKWTFRYYGSGLVDRLFARLFPPERTANGRRSLAYVAERSEHVTRSTTVAPPPSSLA